MMMRVLILLLLSMVAVWGGFEVCREAVCLEQRAVEECRGCQECVLVLSFGEQKKNCTQHHRHEQIHFAPDAGERPQESRLSLCGFVFSKGRSFSEYVFPSACVKWAVLHKYILCRRRAAGLYVLKC